MSDDNEIHSGRRRVDHLADVVQAQVTRGAVMANDLATLVAMVREFKDDHRVFTAVTGSDLEEIKQQTQKTNGRVDRHDDHFTVNDREIKALKDTVAKLAWGVFGLLGTVIVTLIVDWVQRR